MTRIGKNRKIERLRPKFPVQRISEFFAADQGFLKHGSEFTASQLEKQVG